MAVELNNCKLKIFEYVESRMAFIAPNLSVIVGASTAAKIMGIVKRYIPTSFNIEKYLNLH